MTRIDDFFCTARAWRDGQKTQCSAGRSGVKIFTVLLAFSAILAGCAQVRGMVRIEPASAGKTYDYTVHVRNTLDIGYNPEVREDRARMALQILRSRCKAARIVGEDKIITEVWGITSSPPDYIVLVKCT